MRFTDNLQGFQSSVEFLTVARWIIALCLDALAVRGFDVNFREVDASSALGESGLIIELPLKISMNKFIDE